MADLDLEADIDGTVGQSTGTSFPITVMIGAGEGKSTFLSPPPGRRRSNAYSESEGSVNQTPSATDRPHSSFYSVSNAEIFAFAVAYGRYPTMSMISLVIAILETKFFENKFDISRQSKLVKGHKHHNDRMSHMIVYLQVAMISQALIFITRSHGFFFMEHPRPPCLCLCRRSAHILDPCRIFQLTLPALCRYLLHSAFPQLVSPPRSPPLSLHL
jgi:hypothetical protein